MAGARRGTAGVNGALPLAGRRVLVTRAREDALEWAKRLEVLGARPVVLPCVTSRITSGERIKTRLREAVVRADWLVVTSKRAVGAAGRMLGDPPPPSVRIAAVGPATARAAEAAWGRSVLVPRQATSRGLGLELAALLGTEGREVEVVVVGAEGGREDADRALREAGATVTRLEVYRTTPAAANGVKLDLASDEVDDVLLASPSAVKGFVNRACGIEAVRIVTIGPTTTEAARAAGLTVAAEAQHPDFESLVEAILQTSGSC